MKKVIIDGRRFVTDEEFRLAINEALEHSGVQELADHLNVSRLAVKRWASGTSIPLLSLRAVYVTYFEDAGLIA